MLPGGPGGVYGAQVDNGSSNFSAPGVTPDIIGKIAWDRRVGTRALHLEASGLVGDGAGRHFFGTMPDIVVRQSGAPSPVRASGGVAGLEWTPDPGYTRLGYYGRVAAGADFDLHGAAPVGYGFPGSPTSMNRTIEEYTAGAVHTWWKSAQYGTLQLILQASYVTRRPFAGSVPAASGAHAGMGYADLRFTLRLPGKFMHAARAPM